MTEFRYHHLGIPNNIKREGENYLESAKIFHTNFNDNPYGIEWMRFMPGSNVTEVVKIYPHVAFTVDNLEAALEGKKVIIPPNSPSAGVRVAFIEHNGAPIEFLEYDYAEHVTGFPGLETDRLVLRQHLTSDAEILYKLRSNPGVMKFMDIPMMTSQRQAKEFIDKVSRSFIDEKIPLWALSMKDDDARRMIGYVGYIRHLEAHYRAEICYLLEPVYWGRGLMTEALHAALQYGFQQMALHSIEANINPANTTSIKLAEKFNFRREALFKENWFINGKFVDSAIYSLRKADFSYFKLNQQFR